MELNYYKNKNSKSILNSLSLPNILNLTEAQNFSPTYSRFFDINENNYNLITLNNEWQIDKINCREKENENKFNCILVNLRTKQKKEEVIFIKIAPLLDPYKYLVGKYNNNDGNLFNLPTLSNLNVHPKISSIHNSSHVDGFFTFLNSKLIAHFNFFHGVNYFGSFLAIKKDFKINIIDDLDYLVSSDYFAKNKDVLYIVDDYSHIIDGDDADDEKLPPIKISQNSNYSLSSVKTIDNTMFDDLFSNSSKLENDVNSNPLLSEMETCEINDGSSYSIKSNSSCSSRSSVTLIDEMDEKSIGDEEDGDDEDADNDGDEDEDEDEDEDDDDDDDDEEEEIMLTLSKFPVNLICMEGCQYTLDDLLLNCELSDDEWCSCLMQTIMILITYQKAFYFTHNDLHTNNVMYSATKEKYIYYYFNKQMYKVPTFGRIFKIIDFGRSIYKFNGHLFCSDSFKYGEDAASQYNTEPFFNEKKPRLEPNYSFDICRLACSIFDYVIEDITEIKSINKLSNIQRLIYDWCVDDKGVNVLYKNDGSDRYPDFKLYKMIARNVHNHVPKEQLNRPQFKQYVSNLKIDNLKDPKTLINIDKINSLA